jgi:hypothetical protein
MTHMKMLKRDNMYETAWAWVHRYQPSYVRVHQIRSLCVEGVLGPLEALKHIFLFQGKHQETANHT